MTVTWNNGAAQPHIRASLYKKKPWRKDNIPGMVGTGL